jgi:hypothetical protein
MMSQRGLLLAAIATLSVPFSVGAQELGRYRCQVKEVYGIDELGNLWKNADLLFDADAGTLDGSFDPSGDLGKEGLRMPAKRLFSRLKVQTPPSKLNNLHAVQYDPAPDRMSKPIVAWIMIETLDSPVTPRFQLFSTTFRSVAVGRCAHDM